MIPQFPNTKLLTLNDKEDLSKILTKYEAYSDFNFTSLWSYNVCENVQISLLFNNLVIRFKDYLSNTYFYSFFGNTEPLKSIQLLIQQAKKEKIEKKLKLIPEQNFNNIKAIQIAFHAVEDRDHFDYLLSLKDLTALQGSQYKQQRKEIARFFRSHPDGKVIEINIEDAMIQKEIMNLFSLWKRVKNKPDIESERTALERTIKHAGFLDIFAVALYINENMIGFLIADVNNSKYVESHFLKYDPSYIGIKHILHHFLAKQLLHKGYIYLNLEQDFGIPGLRQAKLACRPVCFLKKYIITEK